MQFEYSFLSHFAGVDKMLLLQLMSHTPYLKSLCLRNTNLDDHVLTSLSSTSLEMLDVADNVVSNFLNYKFLPDYSGLVDLSVWK